MVLLLVLNWNFLVTHVIAEFQTTVTTYTLLKIAVFTKCLFQFDLQLLCNSTKQLSYQANNQININNFATVMKPFIHYN